jgi:replication factor A3
MDHPQTPRILAPHLSQFQHRIVRILGKVVQLRGETAIIDAGGNVDVVLNRDSHLAVGHAVEVIGKVDGNLNVKVQACTDFGTNIGMLVLLLGFIFELLLRGGGRWNSWWCCACCSYVRADFNAANAVVEATHRHKAIFYDGE